jgi:acetylornithine deacetylase
MDAIGSAAIELISKLIHFDTSNPAQSNKSILDFIEGYLKNFGLSVERIIAADGIHESLFARLDGSVDVSHEEGIILSGHLDVVPVSGQQWTYSPFEAVVVNNKLYGRGACDMKGFIGCVLASVPLIATLRLRRPIYLSLTYDEETTCASVQELLAYVQHKYPVPYLIIIGEPTGMKVVRGHKGGCDFKTKITGKSAHASRPDLGTNAIVVASELVQFIQQLGKTYWNEQEINTSPTLNVGKIQGGSATNIIPDQCQVEWEFRPNRHDAVKELYVEFERYSDELRKKYPQAKIQTQLCTAIPPLDPTIGKEKIDVFLQTIGSYEETYVSYATEAGFFQQNNIPALVCGPGFITEAHKPDEYVELSQIEKCLSFLQKVLHIVT